MVRLKKRKTRGIRPQDFLRPQVIPIDQHCAGRWLGRYSDMIRPAHLIGNEHVLFQHLLSQVSRAMSKNFTHVFHNNSPFF